MFFGRTRRTRRTKNHKCLTIRYIYVSKAVVHPAKSVRQTPKMYDGVVGCRTFWASVVQRRTRKSNRYIIITIYIITIYLINSDFLQCFFHCTTCTTCTTENIGGSKKIAHIFFIGGVGVFDL